MTDTLPATGSAPTAWAPTRKPPILCVDDEERVLDALQRALRPQFRVSTAPSADEAMRELREASAPFAVVVSDLRMPATDGLSFLRAVGEESPTSCRILLTGYADLETAIAVINTGRIDRLLSKPLRREDLAAALHAGVEQHRLRTAERQLLEETLTGSVQALLDTLSLAAPGAFARATRISGIASDLAAALEAPQRWEIQIGAMLSQIAVVALPATLVAKLDRGLTLTEEEDRELDRLPELAEGVLGHIPRLDGVRAIVRYQRKNFDGSGFPRDRFAGEAIPLGARILRLAADLDQLESARLGAGNALAVLRGRPGAYDPAVLDAATQLLEGADGNMTLVEPSELTVGMVLAQDLVDSAGVLVLGRGCTVTEALVERLRNPAWSQRVDTPIYVQS